MPIHRICFGTGTEPAEKAEVGSLETAEIIANKEVRALGDGPLTAEMILDGKTPELVQVTNPGVNIYRMDLFQAGIPESRRILKGKREIMIKLRKRGTTGYHYLTVGCDRKKRPYAHVMGSILPLPLPQSCYYCLTDHNKNVTGLVDGTGNMWASWDYDAFGNCIFQNGNKADWNSLRYSSEYYDQELGLIYYNYRHYNPRDGRWISRDPIFEKGGVNLYCFSLNNGLVYFDFLGAAIFFVIYYDNSEKDKDGSFKRAAETWAKQVEERPYFNAKCDLVLTFGVKTENDFIMSWNKIYEISMYRRHQFPNDSNIQEGEILTHASIGCLELVPDSGNSSSDGSFYVGETAQLQRLPWNESGILSLRGCRSGIGSINSISIAEAFCVTQQVDSRGEYSYAYFSESKEKYIEISGKTKDVYLRSFVRKGAIAMGYANPSLYNKPLPPCEYNK